MNYWDDTNIWLLPPTMEPWSRGENPDRDIIVLMSGGVDSSVTAMLLKEAGWNTVGVTMKMPVAERCDYQRSCCGIEAAYVCRDLGIPHYYLDVRDAFEKLVIEPFRIAYCEGRTPSPCVDCNTLFKFGLVWDYLQGALGINYLATGHYARVVREGDDTYLTRAIDKSRDQSYFLYGIPRHRLPYFVLPLGDVSKPEVREMAKQAHLPVARRQDSMELCFAGEGDYRNALDSTTNTSGSILDMPGNIIGTHDGIANFTIGQRRGIGVAAGRPLYVAEINPRDNSIRVGSYEDVSCKRVQAEEINVLIPEKLKPGEHIYGKIRSQGDAKECIVTEVDEAQLTVDFDEPQFAPAPGQRLVLYDGDERVVAGGVINTNA